MFKFIFGASMNSLDLLIRRIKDRITVSNEDAVDTVKQYWDDAVDTVKSYWSDVDEAIVEETGIPPASLTQLLDDHRQAHSYANVGGNSGVASYDIGDDWFLVNFTTGSRYLYTTKSATREQLNEMKRYANDGKGLNSYIMRTLKTNYAARNVKGEILIKPGMEHYSRHAVKRIELLEAYRNTMGAVTIKHDRNITVKDKTLNIYKQQIEQAGTDGLDPVARQFMSIGLESLGSDPLLIPGGKVSSMEGIWDSIKDFFAGRPTKIHLSGADRDLRGKLDRTINDRTWLSRQKYTLGEVNYRALPDFNPTTARKYVQDYRLAVNSTSQHNTREMAKIKERLAAVPRMISLYASRDIFDIGLIQTVINDISPYSLRLNINIQEPPLMSTEMTTQTGQALTKVEIKDFAELISQVHAVQSAYEASIYVTPALQWMSQVRFRYANKPGGQEVLAAIQRAVRAYENVVLMINREIKQRVITHAAWINAENIADSMVNYIGKSLTNITTNSFESFNEPVVPSMEDLLGSIKKFFTKGKDTAIYDTVGKGFLQSLREEVKKYTDLSWVKTHGQTEASTVTVNGVNLLPEYDTVVPEFIRACQANRAEHDKVAAQAFDNMETVMGMIRAKKLSNSADVEKAITILKATRQLKQPKVEVPKVKAESGEVKTLSPEEVVDKAKKLYSLFETLSADTKFVDRWNKNFINSHKWMDWKYVGSANYKELADQTKGSKFAELYQKAMEHVYDLRRIGSEFHLLQPYIMAEFELIEKSVKDS